MTIRDVDPWLRARRTKVMGTLLRAAAVLVLVGHGALNLMGTPLRWHMSQPGTLRYADATPAAGTAAALLVGFLCLVCAALFVAAARARVPRALTPGSAQLTTRIAGCGTLS